MAQPGRPARLARLRPRTPAAHRTLSRDLQALSKLSGADYEILVALTDTPDVRQRFQDLAKTVDWEQSRLSHHIARMCKRGLVAREECAEDGRAAYVVLTPAGRTAIETAALHHVATVRRLAIDALSPDELADPYLPCS